MDAQPNIVEHILRSNQKATLPRHALTSTGDNALLAKLCRDYELSGLGVPVLSAYESKESKVSRGVFAKFLKARSVVVSASPPSK